MPREKATVARGRGELKGERLLQSEGWKTKLLLCFCESFQAGNLQAGRQSQDLSKARAQHRDAFRSATCPLSMGQRPAGWGVVGGGGGAARLSTSLCVSICKYEDGRVNGREGCQCVSTSSGQGDEPARPY